jgi:hypothetical protein
VLDIFCIDAGALDVQTVAHMLALPSCTLAEDVIVDWPAGAGMLMPDLLCRT